jgi:hypothetical protein
MAHFGDRLLAGHTVALAVCTPAARIVAVHNENFAEESPELHYQLVRTSVH